MKARRVLPAFACLVFKGQLSEQADAKVCSAGVGKVMLLYTVLM